MDTQELDKQAILRRLAQVERGNRALKIMGVVVVALAVVSVLIGGRPKGREAETPDTIRTRNLIIVDDAGNPVVEVDTRGVRIRDMISSATTELDNTGLRIKWKHDAGPAEAVLVSLGPGGLVVTDKSGAAYLSGRGLALTDATGTNRAELACGRLGLADDIGQPCVQLGVSEEDRSGYLSLTYGNNETWDAP